jgi:hypothetical protein
MVVRWFRHALTGRLEDITDVQLLERESNNKDFAELAGIASIFVIILLVFILRAAF